MTSRFIMPFADVGSGIKPSSGALLYFFEDDGVTPKDTYTTKAATVANANPVTSDSYGVFPAIYIKADYLVTLKDKNNSQIFGLAPIEENSGASDLTLTYTFDTVAEFKSSMIEFPDGKTIHLNDRDADFTKATGTGGGDDARIIDSSQTNSNILMIEKPIMDFKAYGVIGDGITDDSANMQIALNRPVNLVSSPNLTFKTTVTMFNQIPNRTIQFNGSLIKCLANARFGLVTISTALPAQNDSALATFMTENHFSEQIENSNVLGIKCQMQPNTGGGANLGLGVIYGRCCEMKGEVTSSNGNAAQIQGSYDCAVDLKMSGHRSYGMFNYQSKKTDIKVDITGGSRGIIVKHAYYDDPILDVLIHDSIIRNTSDRVIGGGASAGTGGSAALEPAGHEIVGNVTIRDCEFLSDNTVSFGPSLKLGNHTESWNIENVTMKNESTATSTNFITCGGEGTAGFYLGGGHLFENLKISGAIGEGASQIVSSQTARFIRCTIDGEIWRGVYFNSELRATDRRLRSVESCEITGTLINAGGTLGGAIETVSTSGGLSILDNTFDLTAQIYSAIPSRDTHRMMYILNKRAKIRGNTFKSKIPSGQGVGDVALIVTTAAVDQAITTNNEIEITNDVDSISVFGFLDVTGNSIITNNAVNIVQNAGVAGASQGVRYTTGTSQVANNVFSGAWTANEQPL